MERPDLAGQLSALAALHADGRLTADEFSTAKALLLGGTVDRPATAPAGERAAGSGAPPAPTHPGGSSTHEGVRQLAPPLVHPPSGPRGRRSPAVVVGAVVTAVVVLLIGVVVVASRAVGPPAPACDPAVARAIPPQGVALLPGTTGDAAGAPTGGAQIWFAGTGTGGFAVVDPCSETVARTVPAPMNAEDIEFSPDGTTVYTADSFESTVTAIAVDSGKVIARIRVADYHYQKRLALTPDGSRLLATDSYGDKLSIIDTRTNAVVAGVPFGGDPSGAGAWDVIASRDGTTAFVSRPGADEIVEVDVVNGRTVASIRTGDYPRGLAQDERGRIYVAHFTDGTVAVVDPTAGGVTERIAAGDGVDAIATSGDGRRVVALSSQYPTAYVIDPGDGPRSARSVTLPAVLRPGGEKATTAPARYYTYRSLVVSPDGRRLHIASDGNGVTALNI